MAYDETLEIVPDILEWLEVEDGRSFTLKLREGHRWSDGHPLTAEDFRYFWEDVATNEELFPVGPEVPLRLDDELPTFEVIDETTVRCSWSKPNPFFIPALAGARPLEIFRSEEHTSELQSLMRISYAGFCLKKTKMKHTISNKRN